MPIAAWQSIKIEGPVFADFPSGPAFGVIIAAIYLIGGIALLVDLVNRAPGHAVYVLTDQRVMTGVGILRRRVKDGLSLESLQPDHVELRRDDGGGSTIIFWDHAWTDSDGDRHAPEWVLLSDGRRVHDLLRRAVDRA